MPQTANAEHPKCSHMTQEGGATVRTLNPGCKDPQMGPSELQTIAKRLVVSRGVSVIYLLNLYAAHLTLQNSSGQVARKCENSPGHVG